MANSIGELLSRRAREHPERRFLVCGDDALTYSEADAVSGAVASGLADAGVRRGERIAIVSANRIELLELFFACAKLGAVQVPLNVFLKGHFLRYQLEDAEATTVVVDAAGHDAVAGVANVDRIIALEETAGIPFASLRECESSFEPPPLGPRDLLSIVYTSGTTGMPKGCMLSHGWYLNGGKSSAEMFDYRSDDVLYCALPLYHGWARGMVAGALVHGLTAVLDPSFSASRVLHRLSATGATIFKGVGAMGMAMLAAPESAGDRAHRLRVAQIIPFDAHEAFEARFGCPVLSELYGQTECGAIAHGSLRTERRPGSVGRIAPYLDVRIVDEDDNDAEIGEIVVRPRVSDSLYRGYWRKPEETLAAWRNLWHHTGDIGRLDADGFLYFVDRRKDALRRRGENVSSIELEAAIARHPKVAEVAVHAVPSELTEDDIKACLVLVPGEDVTPEELFAYFRDHLPYYAIPRYVELIEELPRNATMRVMKHVLRELGVTESTWDLDALGLLVAPTERR